MDDSANSFEIDIIVNYLQMFSFFDLYLLLLRSSLFFFRGV